MVEGLPVLKPNHINCDACALGNLRRDEFPVNLDRKKRDILELVHTDICGMVQTRSLVGSYYFLVFVDDCMRFT